MAILTGANLAGDLLKLSRQQRERLASHWCNVMWLPAPIWGGLYIVGDAKLQKDILLDRTTEKDDMYDGFVRGIGPSVVSRKTADPHWKVLRKGASPAFAAGPPMELLRKTCQRHVNEWIERTFDRGTKVTTIDPTQEFIRLTLSVILEGAFEFQCSDKEIDGLLHEIQVFMQEYVVEQSMNPFRHWYATAIHAEARRAQLSAKRLQVFGQRILDTYRKRKQTIGQASSTHSLIYLMETNPTLSEADKIADVVTYILAGHETTGNTLANTIYLIGQNPQVARKVQEAQTDPETLAEYTQWCLWESQRMEPAVASGLPRLTGRDMYVQTNSGQTIHIPANRTVLIAPLLCHRDPDVFDDADTYIPERWEALKSDHLLHSFFLGKRKCIGQSFARVELSVVLSRFLSEFTVAVADPGEMREVLTWYHHGGSVRVIRRDDIAA